MELIFVAIGLFFFGKILKGIAQLVIALLVLITFLSITGTWWLILPIFFGSGDGRSDRASEGGSYYQTFTPPPATYYGPIPEDFHRNQAEIQRKRQDKTPLLVDQDPTPSQQGGYTPGVIPADTLQ